MTVRAWSLILLYGLVGVGAAEAGAAPRPVPPEAEQTGAQRLPEEAERRLVGIMLHGREVDTFEVVLLHDEFFVPLQPFAELCGCELEDARGAVRLSTPLGVVELRDDELRDFAGERYVGTTSIAERLAARIWFDLRDYALHFDLPWRAGARVRDDPTHPREMVPDVRPPDPTLSKLQVDARYTRRSESDQPFTNTRVGGRIGGGWWQARVQTDFSGNRSLQEYAWLRTFGRKLLLVGHQQVHLHPLLGSLEMTGVQTAWTNQPLELFAESPSLTELLPRRLRSVSTVRGHGPAAGVAELRVNDRVIARQVISLDGVYEFRDVYLSARQTNRVEVYLYDRFDRAAPVAVQEHTRNVSELLLPPGATVLMGGFGAAGNVTMPSFPRSGSGAGGRPLAGFSQARFGLSERVTLEAVAQQTAQRRQFLTGVTAALGSDMGLSAALGRSGDALGYDLAFDKRGPVWRLTARSRAMQSGFALGDPGAVHDHYLEVAYGRSSRFEASLIGRDRERAHHRVRFVLPALTWRPRPGISLRARPDFDGLYRLDVAAGIGRDWRVGASASTRSAFFDVSRGLGHCCRASVLAELSEGGNRESLLVNWSTGGRWSPSVTVGALLSNGRPGYLLATHFSVRPGVLAGIRLESESMLDLPGAPADRRLVVSLTGDLALSRGRLLAAGSVSLERSVGGLAGRIRIADGYRPADDLAGLTILVDGSPRGSTEPGGEYFIGGLRPGVYRVELDPEGLPIELDPSDASVLAQVVRGAVTRADFPVRVEFGLAGRVTAADGSPLLGLTVELLDDAGDVVATARTDRYGLYRMDGIRIGTYTLRLSPGGAGASPRAQPQRRVEVRDDFLFDQDLQLPAT